MIGSETCAAIPGPCSHTRALPDDGLEPKLLGPLVLCARMAAGGEAVSSEGIRAVYSNIS
jgi:hypothetical protein